MSGKNLTALPPRFLEVFLETLRAEVGAETLLGVCEKAGLPAELTALAWPEPGSKTGSRYTGVSAAEVYARIQKAMRVYYGRGARGSLQRIGRLIWPRLLASASLAEKAHAQLIRALPLALRPKATLELLAGFLRETPAGVSIHTLDLDLMLVDHAAAAALGQSEAAPICYVTLGLIHEALLWATGREHDLDEVSCRASGGDDCEFKIKLDGK